jgi:hypothetical protein
VVCLRHVSGGLQFLHGVQQILRGAMLLRKLVDETYAPGSDLDMFIVLTDSDKPVRDRIPDFMPNRFPVPVDIFPYTKTEIAELAASLLLSPAALRAREEDRGAVPSRV